MSVTAQQCANAIRVLSMDAVQRANSGHPGAPMGLAEAAYVLWKRHLKHSPQNPAWLNRDRFVLSNGHASILLYVLLHLTGYDMSIDDLKSFRQLHSKTPGHPELGVTPGVETTTGPLGQGLSNAVGMALAEKVLAQTFNRPDCAVVDHYTYVFAGDGCLMEGISHEVCSLAGTLGLGKLIVLWDDNGISIDGSTMGWFTDDTPGRFESYGWQVIRDIDGHNIEALDAAFREAKANLNQPTLIACRTVIAKGAPSEGTAKTHGSPLGEKEIEAVRKQLSWAHQPFEVSDALMEAWSAVAEGGIKELEWQALWRRYEQQYPELAEELHRRLEGGLPSAFTLEVLQQKLSENLGKSVATRKASQMVIEAMGGILPELLGGSADLTESNLTHWSGSRVISTESAAGNYLHYGVREFGMNAIMNGLAIHGGFIPYGGTFLTFYDYGKNAVRMAALMKQRVVFVYTHDSIGLGEDGPTHQPVEQLANLRSVPGLRTWRPADLMETIVAWHESIAYRHGPSALCLTRQNLPALSADRQLSSIAKGAYVVFESQSAVDLLIIATGSEVSLAIEAAQVLSQTKALGVRVVSMPCMEQFLSQTEAVREAIIPSSVKRRVAIEAAHSQSWYRWVGLEGLVIGVDRFGESAPGQQLFSYFGLECDKIVSAIESWV